MWDAFFAVMPATSGDVMSHSCARQEKTLYPSHLRTNNNEPLNHFEKED
jgi:hypothetical protein